MLKRKEEDILTLNTTTATNSNTVSLNSTVKQAREAVSMLNYASPGLRGADPGGGISPVPARVLWDEDPLSQSAAKCLWVGWLGP